MKPSELLTRIVITVFSLGVVVLPLALWAQTPLIHARIAEGGGWSPDVIQAKVGQPLHLKFTSDDVMHGFAVGQMEMQPVDIEPGKVSETTLTFDKPGIYTFFCTRWCGLNHWRMRGTIEVAGSETGTPEPASPPLYVTLGLDLDKPHTAPFVPDGRPSAANGQKLAASLLISRFTTPDYYRSHSPAQLFDDLRSTGLSDSQRWDLVAAIWQSNTTPAGLAAGQQLFAQNCAACHGEKGGGNGVFAKKLSAAGAASAPRAGTGTTSQAMSSAQDMVMQTPATFADPQRMLGASPALLQGKILRGGMGTGMPMWGSIYTEEQIWNIISYLYTFQFDTSNP
jgi:mono/diheme cytochrome c family protein/plastocyanin